MTDTVMSLLSSPLAYPPSSSPPAVLETRKRSIPIEAYRESKRRLAEHKIVQIERGVLRETVANYPTPEASSDSPDGNAVAEIESGKISSNEADILPRKPTFSATFPSLGRSLFDKSRKPEEGTSRLSEVDLSKDDPSQGDLCVRTASGKTIKIKHKAVQASIPYNVLIAERSTTGTVKAQKSYYGIDIHQILDQAVAETNSLHSQSEVIDIPQPSIEVPHSLAGKKRGKNLLWTEKYRARKFTDLVGDERTHRTVLRWLKGWDPIVFPGIVKPKPKSKSFDETAEEKAHRKILLLTGPPGLGKTTLAHVCARQAGYEVVEINASDERSGNLVRGRIRDIVGTENVKGVNTKSDNGTVRKAGRPVCVVVDEVDGVTSGGGSSGESGFIKALMDLVTLDQKNSNPLGASPGNTSTKRSSRKGERFRLLRPLILICNDIYHPSLRPLRSSSLAEIIHLRKPLLEKVVARLKTVFEKESIPHDSDGVRRLCEAAWGISNRRSSARTDTSSTAEGDLRSIFVVGEWVASKLRASQSTTVLQKCTRLTRSWVEKNVLESLSHGGGSARGIGFGGAKEAVQRVFQEGAGFPITDPSPPSQPCISISLTESTVGSVSSAAKQRSSDRLREIIDACGDTDRIMTDCFATYPTQQFQDDTYLSKPNAAYEWLHFHDTLSSKVHQGQEWELAPYLSQPIIGFHHLFASPSSKHSWVDEHQKRSNFEDKDGQEEQPKPFSGPRADYEASESLKQNKSILQTLQSSLSLPLFRQFHSLEDISTDFLPYLLPILRPNIKPVVVGGSGDQRGIVSVRKEVEKGMLARAVSVMHSVGVVFERSRVEGGYAGVGGWVYRMEP